MSHTPHELAEEFPADIDRIQALKAESPHFARLHDDYHVVNRTIHRAETLVEPITEEAEAALRKQRLALKDEIARHLRIA